MPVQARTLTISAKGAEQTVRAMTDAYGVDARVRAASEPIALSTTVYRGEGMESTILDFHAEARFGAEPFDDRVFFIQVERGVYEWEVRRETHVVQGGAPFLLPTNERFAVRLAETVFRTTSIPSRSIDTRAEAMDSGGIRSRARFEPTTPTLGHHFDAVLTTAQNVLATPELYANDLIRESTIVAVIDAAIATYGLLGDAHAVRNPPNSARRAVHYLWEHLAEPVRIENVAAAAHVSVRALQELFLREYGHSPSAELRRMRLHSARQALLASDDPETTVRRVAHESGFVNLGRFAADYRKEFGELPSRTLRTH